MSGAFSLMSFDQLGLTPELLRAVAAQGYTEPTPVQRESIPFVPHTLDLADTSFLDLLGQPCRTPRRRRRECRSVDGRKR